MGISTNTTSLEYILETINALPEGAELPELTSEGVASDLMSGKELIDQDGNVVTGTFTIEDELNTQDNLIAQIQTAVNELPDAGSGEGGSEGNSFPYNVTVTYSGIPGDTDEMIMYYGDDGASVIIYTGVTAGLLSSHPVSSIVTTNCQYENWGALYFPFVSSGMHTILLYNIIGDVEVVIKYQSVHQCCFVAGTQILKSLNGEMASIEELRAGDSVISYNINTNENYIAQVKKLIIHENTTDIAEVSFDNGSVLTMNAYHPIYTENGWHSITNHNNYDTLVVGDKVKTLNGWSNIINICRYNSEPIITYNLDVVDINENPDIETNDNFYANGIVVHNGYC